MKHTKMTVALFAAIVALMLTSADSCAAEAVALSGTENGEEDLLNSGDNIASGVIDEDYGKITWVIDSTGKLTVSGTGDVSLEDDESRSPWYAYREEITSAEINVSGMTNAYALFSDCSSLTEIDLSNFDTGSVTNMSEMFVGCSSLTSLDLSSFDTRNVTDMSYMFNACMALTKLDLSGFDTSCVTTVEGMFSICIELAELDVSGFDTGNVTDMKNLFVGCNSLESLDLSSFDMGNVTNVEDMFGACQGLKQIKTPVNCACTADLPADPEFQKWCLPDGTVITALPQGLSESVTILRKDTVMFTDVEESAFYYDAVKWALENEITSGITATQFGPSIACNRAHMVSFLWRAQGSPEPTITECPFTDVLPGAYYYDAVLWALENEITSGTTPTTFSPSGVLTRGQSVTFLYKFAGNPETDAELTFKDVKADAFYADAVRWAAAENVTSGTTPTTFSPTANCTRGQIVTLLYRFMGEE